MTTQGVAKTLGCLALLLVAAAPARAEVFGGVNFPQGAISFADQVASYNPVINNGEPIASLRNSQEALGTPNYTAPDAGFVTLGSGGSITLQFTNNALTGSGNSGLDLWIFEIGEDVEDTFVEISKNGTTWLSVGKVGGSTSGVDIDAFGYGSSDLFLFVRLTDDPNEGDKSGYSVGADIDALGAISTVPRSVGVPEPSSAILLALGAASLFVYGRRRPRRCAVSCL